MAKVCWNKKLKVNSVKILKIKQNGLYNNKRLIVNQFLAGNIILIEDFKMPINLEEFNFSPINISMPKGINPGSNLFREYNKKTKPITKALTQNAANFIYKYPEQRDRLTKTMMKCDDFVTDMFKTLFSLEGTPSLNGTTWRFTKTTKQNYHLDIYTGSAFRAFWNLSDKPRKWGFGYNAKHIFEKYNLELNTFIKDKEISGEKISQASLNAYINQLISDEETHKIEFDKYDLWICDTVKVGHQIISGDKLAAFTYLFKKEQIPIPIANGMNYMNYIKTLR